jgi:uncharacterized protein YeaO (DUF488 family)
VQPKTTGTASAGKTLLPTRSPAEAVSFCGHIFRSRNSRATIFNTLIKVKRIYQAPQSSDGCRILVDRVWPRGISKERADVALWLKEIGPSTGLRKWFGHDPERWSEFQKRYRQELRSNAGPIARIKQLEKEHGVVTLVFSARDEKRNQATVLRDFLATPPGMSARRRGEQKVKRRAEEKKARQ